MTILIGCSLMSSGVFLTYYTIQHSMFLATLTYGLMFGIGTALAYAPPMAVAMRWYPEEGARQRDYLGRVWFGCVHL